MLTIPLTLEDADHTFASQLLSNDVPLEWVAQQLGHSDTTMIKKHYDQETL